MVASDLTPENLAAGRAAAEARGIELEWVEADAEALPFADGAFDVVTSAFGVMFAPDHRAAARELLRVCRPGGTIALASFAPGRPGGRLLRHARAPRAAAGGRAAAAAGAPRSTCATARGRGRRAALRAPDATSSASTGGPEDYAAFFTRDLRAADRAARAARGRSGAARGARSRLPRVRPAREHRPARGSGGVSVRLPARRGAAPREPRNLRWLAPRGTAETL